MFAKLGQVTPISWGKTTREIRAYKQTYDWPPIMYAIQTLFDNHISMSIYPYSASC